jgi:hypothetical protein
MLLIGWDAHGVVCRIVGEELRNNLVGAGMWLFIILVPEYMLCMTVGGAGGIR